MLQQGIDRALVAHALPWLSLDKRGSCSGLRNHSDG